MLKLSIRQPILCNFNTISLSHAIPLLLFQFCIFINHFRNILFCIVFVVIHVCFVLFLLYFITRGPFFALLKLLCVCKQAIKFNILLIHVLLINWLHILSILFKFYSYSFSCKCHKLWDLLCMRF